MQANSKNFSYSRNLFSDILAYIKNNAYLCSENIINNVSHNFCFNGARRCETMGIFYCLIVDINNIVEIVVDIKDIVKFMTSPAIEFVDKISNSNIYTGYFCNVDNAIRIALGDYSSIFKKYYKQKGAETLK